MMKSKWLFILAGAIILLLALSSCGGSGTPTCPTGSLQAPILSSPANWAVEPSLLPSLSWSYPDASCNPQGYAIDLATGPLFADSLGGGTGNPTTSWSPGSPLQPGKEYAWGVQAINGSTLGPYAGSRYFFTGPMCNTAALTAPSLLQPANASVITELEPTLMWQYPNPCLPQGYRVDLSTDVTFADTSLSGGTGNPSTRWWPGEPLKDCMVYFWKITPINDTTLGPASGVFSFMTNVLGTCPTPTPVGPTPTPVEPTFTPTPVPLAFIPNINSYCRIGPDLIFNSIALAMNGESYPLDGRNKDGTWFRLMVTPDVGCWVPASAGMPTGDISGLRVLYDIPTPTVTPIPFCSQYTDEKSCNAQRLTCHWYRPSTGAPGTCLSN